MQPYTAICSYIQLHTTTYKQIQPYIQPYTAIYWHARPHATMHSHVLPYTTVFIVKASLAGQAGALFQLDSQVTQACAATTLKHEWLLKYMEVICRYTNK